MAEPLVVARVTTAHCAEISAQLADTLRRRRSSPSQT
jgi:hypothetical protein